MDISERAPQQPVQLGQSVANKNKDRASKVKKGLWGRVGVITALIAVVILLVGIIALVYAQNNNSADNESKYIYTNKLQAVFLNTGQVYFGNIKVLNDKFLVLTNIFYLQTSNSGSSSNSSNSNSNVTLVKLGCELHRPYDQMVINRTQVTFWEDLQSDGQVASAVSTFEQQNPNGQKCVDQSNSSSNTSNSVQNAPSKQ